MKLIDLSHNLENLSSVFPGDADFSLIPQKDLKKDGYTLYKIETNLHVGTHIDAPVHLSNREEYINQIELEKFFGDAILLDVRGISVISAKDKWWDIIKPNQIVLLLTGWDKYYGEEKYYLDHPVIDDSFSDLLIAKKIKMLGIDCCSPDSDNYPQHLKLLGNGILLLENLTNLSSLIKEKNIKICAFPIKFHAEASFVRAVALILK